MIKTINLSPIQANFMVDGVKLTFFAKTWQELQNRKQIFENFWIAELPILAVMKVNTLFLRAKYRDYR